MEIDSPLPLLGGLSARQFMRRHWQKKPLLVRQAVPGMVPPLPRAALFDLAVREEVESRLIRHTEAGWTLKHGPFARRALPQVACQKAKGQPQPDPHPQVPQQPARRSSS